MKKWTVLLEPGTSLKIEATSCPKGVTLTIETVEAKKQNPTTDLHSAKIMLSNTRPAGEVLAPFVEGKVGSRMLKHVLGFKKQTGKHLAWHDHWKRVGRDLWGCSIRELVQRQPTDITAINNVGKGGLKALTDALHKNGLRLGMTQDEVQAILEAE